MDERAESKSQPYAYVADVVHEVKLGVDVDEVRGRGVTNDAWTAMVELRDKIAPGEKVAWFVVVCGDVERWAPPTVQLLEGSNGHIEYPLSAGSIGSAGSVEKRQSTETSSRPGTSKGLKKFFSARTLRKSKSIKSIRNRSDASSPPPPSLPTSPLQPPPSPRNKDLPMRNGVHTPSSNGYQPQAPTSVPGTAV